jgi:hypothetical protein
MLLDAVIDAPHPGSSPCWQAVAANSGLPSGTQTNSTLPFSVYTINHLSFRYRPSGACQRPGRQ